MLKSALSPEGLGQAAIPGEAQPLSTPEPCRVPSLRHCGGGRGSKSKDSPISRLYKDDELRAALLRGPALPRILLGNCENSIMGNCGSQRLSHL